jgi:uncharacterized YigZ family protein
MSLRYPVPAARQVAQIEISRSRFIATADYCPTVEAARGLLDEVRQAMPDASHHVHAFIVGHGASVTRGMSDDREPSGTAGRPTMAVIEGSGLGDLCVVTTRYFGGKKLGTGGLVKAYTQAAQAVLEALPRRMHEERDRYKIQVPYPLYEQALLLLEAAEANLDPAQFLVSVEIRFDLVVDKEETLRSALSELSAGRVALERL